MQRLKLSNQWPGKFGEAKNCCDLGQIFGWFSYVWGNWSHCQKFLLRTNDRLGHRFTVVTGIMSPRGPNDFASGQSLQVCDFKLQAEGTTNKNRKPGSTHVQLVGGFNPHEQYLLVLLQNRELSFNIKIAGVAGWKISGVWPISICVWPWSLGEVCQM